MFISGLRGVYGKKPNQKGDFRMQKPPLQIVM